MAMEDGGITRKDLQGSSTGVYIGKLSMPLFLLFMPFLYGHNKKKNSFKSKENN
jgi:hypothetical protein